MPNTIQKKEKSMIPENQIEKIKAQSNTLAQFLEIRKSHLSEVLPKSIGLTSNKLIKLALLAAKNNPALAQCEMDSVFHCLLQCAELGLEPNGPLGGAYLIPFKGRCTLVIGYRGLIDLARRSGALKQIEAHVVHMNDKFELKYGLNPILEHTPAIDEDPGPPRLAYCVAQLEDGAKHFEVMRLSEIRKIEEISKTKRDDAPWRIHWEEMAKKTVARRTCKWIPMSTELARAFEIEENDDIIEVPATEIKKSQTYKLKELIRTKIDEQTGEVQEQIEEPGAEG